MPPTPEQTTGDAAPPPPGGDRHLVGSTAGRQLGLIAAAQVLVMACWFSASALVPALRTQSGVSALQATLLTVAVRSASRSQEQSAGSGSSRRVRAEYGPDRSKCS